MDDVITTTISSLNVEQLGQVHNMLLRQQGQLVERSQALGRQIDDIRAVRSGIAAEISKLREDMNFLAARMEVLRGHPAAVVMANDPRLAASAQSMLAGRNATVPGVVLEAKAS